MFYLPQGCTLTINGPQVVSIGMDAHYGQSQGYAPVPVPNAAPHMVPSMAPSATPYATPGLMPQTVSAPNMAPGMAPSATPYATPQMVPQPMAAPNMVPGQVPQMYAPPPMLGNNLTPYLVPGKTPQQMDMMIPVQIPQSAPGLDPQVFIDAAHKAMEEELRQQLQTQALRQEAAYKAEQADDGAGAMGGSPLKPKDSK